MHACTKETRLKSISNSCNLQALEQRCSINGLNCVEETTASAPEYLREKINVASTKAVTYYGRTRNKTHESHAYNPLAP